MTGNYSWQQKADKILNNFSTLLSERPGGYCYAMSALDFVIGPTKEIIIASDETGSDFQKFVDLFRKNFIPRKIVLARVGGDNTKAVWDLAKIAPYVLEKRPLQDKVTAYICEKQTCTLPITNLKVLKEKIFQ